MTGKKNSPSIEALLDALFEELSQRNGERALDPRMALRPDPEAQSYFIAAPHPRLTLDDMLRPDKAGTMAEVERVLADMPADRRAAFVARLRAAYEALAPETADGDDAEPPSLIYALH